MGGKQRDKAPVEWPRSEGGGEVGPDGGIDDQGYGNRRQTDKVKERTAPSNVIGRGPGAWHFAPPGKITSGERRAASGRFSGRGGKL